MPRKQRQINRADKGGLRSDIRVLREKMLSLSGSDARTLRIGKSTIHYLRKRAEENRPFKIYSPVLTKLSHVVVE